MKNLSTEEVKLKELKTEIEALYFECQDLSKLYQEGFLSFFEFAKQLKKINEEIRNFDREIIKIKNSELLKLSENEVNKYLIAEFYNPLCTCPKYDNESLIGTELRYYHDDCLIHGTHGGNHDSEN